MMQDWQLLTLAAIAFAVLVKQISHGATATKRKFDKANVADPIVSFFAWLDRVTSLRRP